MFALLVRTVETNCLVNEMTVLGYLLSLFSFEFLERSGVQRQMHLLIGPLFSVWISGFLVDGDMYVIVLFSGEE